MQNKLANQIKAVVSFAEQGPKRHKLWLLQEVECLSRKLQTVKTNAYICEKIMRKIRESFDKVVIKL